MMMWNEGECIIILLACLFNIFFFYAVDYLFLVSDDAICFVYQHFCILLLNSSFLKIMSHPFYSVTPLYSNGETWAEYITDKIFLI